RLGRVGLHGGRIEAGTGTSRSHRRGRGAEGRHCATPRGGRQGPGRRRAPRTRPSRAGRAAGGTATVPGRIRPVVRPCPSLKRCLARSISVPLFNLVIPKQTVTCPLSQGHLLLSRVQVGEHTAPVGQI